MKAIDGVELKNEIAAVNAASLEAQKTKLREKISHILGEHSASAGSVAQCKKALEKAEASHAKHQARLDKLNAGDWTVLDEKIQGGEKKPEGGAPAAE